MTIRDDLQKQFNPASKFDWIVTTDGTEPKLIHIDGKSTKKHGKWRTISHAVNDFKIPIPWLFSTYPVSLGKYRLNGNQISQATLQLEIEKADLKQAAMNFWLKAKAGDDIRSMLAIERFQQNQLRDSCPEERHLFAD